MATIEIKWTAAGNCDYNCPLKYDEFKICRMYWSSTVFKRLMKPGPDCPGPGVYELVRKDTPHA